MTEADIPAVAEAHVRGWQWAYRGLIPRSHLDGLDAGVSAERHRARFGAAHGTAEEPVESPVEDLVAEDAAGRVVGWACLGPYRRDEGESDELAADGELYAIYLLPEYVGRGIGRALAEAVMARAADRGFPWLRLWVLEGNRRARGFYERAGFAPDGGAEPFTVAGVDVPEVRYALRLTPAAPDRAPGPDPAARPTPLI